MLRVDVTSLGSHGVVKLQRWVKVGARVTFQADKREHPTSRGQTQKANRKWGWSVWEVLTQDCIGQVPDLFFFC